MKRLTLVLPLAILSCLLVCSIDTISVRADATYQSIEWGLKSAHVVLAQQASVTKGAHVSVCVIDTGVTPVADLAGSIVGGIDTVDPTTPNLTADTFGHGTASASLIAANGTNLLGVAPKASILVAKALNSKGSGDSVSVTSAMLWCGSHGASVISMSLGGSAVNYDGESQAEKWLCSTKAIVTVASAGNDGAPGYSDPTDPANVSSKCVVAVGAIGPDGQLTRWSNYGQNKQEIDAPGLNIAVDTPSGAVGMESGTSAAAPFVSGTLALLVGMGLTPLQALHDVLKTASHPKYYSRATDGSGNLDAYAAVKLAKAQIAARP